MSVKVGSLKNTDAKAQNLSPEAKGVISSPMESQCAICGDTFQQAREGRRRKVCRKPECDRQRRKLNEALGGGGR